MLSGLLILLATVAAMELVATLVHKYVMHGWGWGWHLSHHSPRSGWFERNDLYALVFAAISLGLFVAGGSPASPCWWVGAGSAAYGLLYALLHHGLVHRRLPIGRRPQSAYLKRLVQAHRLHHAVHGRDGAVSFGFLYAPPVAKLVAELRSRRAA
jgi:beta-carotene 3-hydroxylase